MRIRFFYCYIMLYYVIICNNTNNSAVIIFAFPLGKKMNTQMLPSHNNIHILRKITNYTFMLYSMYSVWVRKRLISENVRAFALGGINSVLFSAIHQCWQIGKSTQWSGKIDGKNQKKKKKIKPTLLHEIYKRLNVLVKQIDELSILVTLQNKRIYHQY